MLQSNYHARPTARKVKDTLRVLGQSSPPRAPASRGIAHAQQNTPSWFSWEEDENEENVSYDKGELVICGGRELVSYDNGEPVGFDEGELVSYGSKVKDTLRVLGQSSPPRAPASRGIAHAQQNTPSWFSWEEDENEENVSYDN
jgi:hypothetical protein